MMKDKSFKEIYEQIEVPTKDVQQSIRIGIQRAGNGAVRKNPLLRNLSVAAALVITAFITLGAAFPSFAAQLPIIGNIYKLFEDNEREYIFDEYETHSTKLDMTKESNGIGITLTEAVYDGENITIAFMMDSERDLGDEPSIEWDWNPLTYLYGDQIGSTISKKLGENKYAGLVMINIINGNRPDKIEFTWEGNRVVSFDGSKKIEGKWSFDLTLDNIGSGLRKFEDIASKGEDIEVKLKNMTTTPISTSFYFKEIVDRKVWKEENWSAVFFDYEMSDNLGNVYTMVGSGSYGGYIEKTGRTITTEIDEKATSIIITPLVTIYKEKSEQNQEEPGIENELAKPPFKLEPIEVPLK